MMCKSEKGAAVEYLARCEVDEVEEEGGQNAHIASVLELQAHGQGLPDTQRSLLGVLPQPLRQLLHLLCYLFPCMDTRLSQGHVDLREGQVPP